MRPLRSSLLPVVTIALGLCAAAPRLRGGLRTADRGRTRSDRNGLLRCLQPGRQGRARRAAGRRLRPEPRRHHEPGPRQTPRTDAAVRSGFPDGVYTIDWTLADGDKVVIRNTFRGTHQGEFAGVPASGNKVAIGAFHVHRVECGKIAETWNAGDALGLFHQMGALDLNVTTAPDDETPPSQPPKMAECVETTPEQNVAAARRWYDEALNQRKLEVLDEFVWPNMVHHAGLFPDAVGAEA